VGVLMRYLERLTVYFLNPVKPVLFGNPLVFSLPESQLPTMRLEDLYQLAIQHLGPLLKLTLVEKDGVIQYPFKFRQVNRYVLLLSASALFSISLFSHDLSLCLPLHRNGSACSKCTWNQFCLGCDLTAEEVVHLNDGTTLALDWDSKLISIAYDSAKAKVFLTICLLESVSLYPLYQN